MHVTLRELYALAGSPIALERGVEAMARAVGSDAELRFSCVGGGEAVVLVLDGSRLSHPTCRQGSLPAMAYCPLDLDEEEGIRYEVRSLDGVLVQRSQLGVDALT